MQPKQSLGQTQQDELHLFVLDVLRHDVIEQVSSIVRLLNDNSGCIGWRDFWPHDFSTTEVVAALVALARDGNVMALREKSGDDDLVQAPLGDLDASTYEEVWFGLTDKGRQLLYEWQPPRS